MSDLEETKIGLDGLLGEVSGLKHHLMAHAKCNDPNIDRWLDNDARRSVQTSNEIFVWLGDRDEPEVKNVEGLLDRARRGAVTEELDSAILRI